jgi:hypothetical protein
LSKIGFLQQTAGASKAEMEEGMKGWAHSENQPLTIYFVGGFFFGARFTPGFEGKGWWELPPF